MAEPKTRPTGASVDDFIAAVPDPQRRADAATVRDMMERLSGEPATLWGPSIIGFGSYTYTSGGKPAEMCRIGFSPRAKELVLYLIGGFPRHEALMAQLGKHRTGQSCLYIKRLSDVDMGVLETLIGEALVHMDTRYPRA